MIYFFLGLAILVFGYVVYGSLVQRIFGADPNRQTPAFSDRDDIDFVPMNPKRNALIQLLNIAGVGPIFGPIMGALFGPIAFVWIALGAVFAGGVHDYLIGMISVRNRGAHLPDLAGRYMGASLRHVVNFFCLLLLLLVATVFVTAPARLIFDMMAGSVALLLITICIFTYYLVATVLPIQKIIGPIYPWLGGLLVVCSAAVLIMLFYEGWPLPAWDGFFASNTHPKEISIFPMLFLTISCGALSGFHATQTPIISRTLQNERQGRPIFYGMMILEGVIAMIWCAGALALKENGLIEAILLGSDAAGPAGVVETISLELLGPILGTAAIVSVIILPITSGDTAFRSARMIIGDYLKLSQSKLTTRILLALPLFGLSLALTLIDFSLLWRYFSWANQTIAAISLWMGAIYLKRHHKCHWIALVPAIFITAATFAYILHMPIGFRLPLLPSQIIGIGMALLLGLLFILKSTPQEDGNDK